MTINEGIIYLHALKARHKELVDLRDLNKADKYYRDSDYVEKANYDVKSIDAMVQKVAAEIRRIDTAIKKANAITEIEFIQNETVFDPIQ